MSSYISGENMIYYTTNHISWPKFYVQWYNDTIDGSSIINCYYKRMDELFLGWYFGGTILGLVSKEGIHQ